MAKPFAAQGSGSYAAISILERDYKSGMSVSVFVYIIAAFHNIMSDKNRKPLDSKLCILGR